MKNVFLKTIDGELCKNPPVWMMRQAGRYLPEYREIRAKTPSFLEFCYNPKLASEATLQPIRRFGLDAAIMFSDILVMPDAMGQRVWFETGEGPRLDALVDAKAIDTISDEPDMAKLSAMFETLELSKAALPDGTALIGFCGAPWTVASYMIAGKGSQDQMPARLFAYRYPDAFQRLIDKLIHSSVLYLCGQLQAGADVVQIFDSWAGVLPTGEFERWCLQPIQAIVTGIRARIPEARIIAFPRGAGTRLGTTAAQLPVQVIGVDTSADLEWVCSNVPSDIAIQGNLDPLVLVAGGYNLDKAINHILEAMKGRRLIFNLGHGIVPETPISHVEHMLRRLRAG